MTDEEIAETVRQMMREADTLGLRLEQLRAAGLCGACEGAGVIEGDPCWCKARGFGE